jgi:hypothetical protein
VAGEVAAQRLRIGKATGVRTPSPRSTAALAVATVLSLGLLAACGGDDGDAADDVTSTASPLTEAPDTTATAASTSTTGLPITTSARTEPRPTLPTTTGPPTTPGSTLPPPTTGPCVPPDERVPDGEDGAARSTLVGREIQTVDGGCYERVLITLVGDGEKPAARAEYASEPVTAPDGSVIESPEVLLLRVNAQMRTPDGGGYQGPTDIETANVVGITRLVLVDESDGTHTWALAVTGRRDFRLTTRADTTAGELRIVLDVATV